MRVEKLIIICRLNPCKDSKETEIEDITRSLVNRYTNSDEWVEIKVISLSDRSDLTFNDVPPLYALDHDLALELDGNVSENTGVYVVGHTGTSDRHVNTILTLLGIIGPVRKLCLIECKGSNTGNNRLLLELINVEHPPCYYASFSEGISSNEQGQKTSDAAGEKRMADQKHGLHITAESYEAFRLLMGLQSTENFEINDYLNELESHIRILFPSLTTQKTWKSDVRQKIEAVRYLLGDELPPSFDEFAFCYDKYFDPISENYFTRRIFEKKFYEYNEGELNYIPCTIFDWSDKQFA